MDGAWQPVVSTVNVSARTVNATINGSGTFQLVTKATASATPWDVNGDGVVNIFDLVGVARVFGTSVPAGSPEDVNGDGVVNIFDLVTVSSRFGQTTAAAAPSVAVGDPKATLQLRLVETNEAGVTEVQVIADSSVEIVGYGLTLGFNARATMERIESGDLLGERAYWMKPTIGQDTAEIASVRLDLRELSDADKSSGVLARLFVRGDGSGISFRDITLSDRDGSGISFRDITLSDRDGVSIGYRTGLPVAPTTKAFRTALLPNYPNPFNPETWVPFSLSEESEVRIDIYDMNGRSVRTLELGRLDAGDYTSRSNAGYWDGRNALGERVASGVYFYKMTAGSFTQMRRLVIMK